MVVAVPKYVGNPGSSPPPGHRFRLYWAGWNEGWKATSSAKDAALEACAKPSRDALASSRALIARRDTLARRDSPAVVRRRLRTTSPLVTGMGIDHPIENGMAFLDPHGVPYLPGSGVKGALRRAAEELAVSGPGSGWTLSDVWYFFGFDATSSLVGLKAAVEGEGAERFGWLEPLVAPLLNGRDLARFLHELSERRADRDAIHYRGALCCWDGLVVTPEGGLRVDIMNPHHTGYYQGAQPPSDDETPKPIKFLCVPPGADVDLCFSFEEWLPKRSPGAERWRELVCAAVDHVALWLGCGGKTSVGYGRLAAVGQSAERAAASSGEATTSERTERWEGCRLEWRPNDGCLTVSRGSGRAEARGQRAQDLRNSLPEGARDRLKKKKSLASVIATVRISGNLSTIVAIEVSA